MSGEVRLNALSTWFESPSSECVSDRRLTEWRGNYDEAVAIARYVRWIAERNGKARRAQRLRRNLW